MVQVCKSLGYWMFFACVYAGATVLLTAMLGAMLFALLGPLCTQYGTWVLLKKGFWTGAHYGGVWAGGLAIVLCVMRKHRLSRLAQSHSSTTTHPA